MTSTTARRNKSNMPWNMPAGFLRQTSILGDFKDVGPTLPDRSINLIYTDPPYARALARPCFELLAEHAQRLLTDGGSLVTIVPHYFLEEVGTKSRSPDRRSSCTSGSRRRPGLSTTSRS